jgi:hypothetical protein
MTTAQMILEDSTFEKAEVSYVSVYEKNVCYGGPEEGGWWHTYYKYLGSVKFHTYEQAQAYVAKAEEQAHELRMAAMRSFRDCYSVNHQDPMEDIEDDFCRGEMADASDYVVEIEQVPGSMDNSNEAIPHWE